MATKVPVLHAFIPITALVLAACSGAATPAVAIQNRVGEPTVGDLALRVQRELIASRGALVASEQVFEGYCVAEVEEGETRCRATQRWNADDRAVERTDDTDGDGVDDVRVTFQLDGAGRRSAAVAEPLRVGVDVPGETRYQRDGDGRLLVVEQGGRTTERYSYDERGRLATLSAEFVGEHQVTYEGNDVTIEQSKNGWHSGEVDSIHYDGAGRVLSREYGSEAVRLRAWITYQYDARGRLTRIDGRTEVGGDALESARTTTRTTVTYDRDGFPVLMEQSDDGVARSRTRYRYDCRHPLPPEP